MRRMPVFPILWLALSPINAALAATSHSDPRPVLPRPAFASLGGSGITNYVGAAVDASGNVYVTGTTSAPDFPVKNAAQPTFGDSAIVRTTDLGKTWTRVAAPADVTTIVPDPVDPLVVYGTSSRAVYKSSDGGRTWRSVLEFQTASGITVPLAIDPGNHLRLAVSWPNSPVMRSLDGGATWSAGGACPVYSCGGSLIADPTGSGALIVFSFQPTISLDWGATFRPLPGPGPGMLAVMAFDPAHRGWIWAGTASGTLGAFFLSTDFGATWTAKASPPDGFSAMLNLLVDPEAPNTLIGTTPTGVFLSTDGAGSWKLISGPGATPLVDTHAPMALLPRACASASTLVARVSGSGGYAVGFSPDYGATWSAPQLSNVSGIAAGAGCAVYVTRTTGNTADAFVAKFAPDGALLWSTYLGGLDQDTPVGLALDARGGVYVGGTTLSPDFPATKPALGPRGRADVFLNRYSADGKLEFSLLFAGEAYDSAVAVGADRSGNAWVAGATGSRQFPLTPNAAWIGFTDRVGGTGFLVKVAPDSTVLYSSFLGDSGDYPSAMVVNARDQAILAATEQQPGSPFLMRWEGAGTQVANTAKVSIPLVGVKAIAQDPAGNLLAMGTTFGGFVAPSPGAFQASSAVACPTPNDYSIGGDIYISKLAAADWQPVYTALLRAPCKATPGALAVDLAGSPVVTLSTGAGFPLARPLLTGPTCTYNTAAVAKLSADGSRLDFSTYLPACGAPALALGADGAIYAGLGSGYSAAHADILKLRPDTAGPSLNGIANAFSADNSAVVIGGLYSLAVSGVALPSIDLTLHPDHDLPTQLGGVEVRFDELPAQIVQTAPGRVTVVAPRLGGGRGHTKAEHASTVRVFVNGVASNAVVTPVAATGPAILTTDFLDPAPHDSLPDGYILNQDGTVNSKDNPAPSGSTVTLFVTGMGTSPKPVYPSWDTGPFGKFTPTTATPLPGFVPAVQQLPIPVPDSSVYTGAADVGDGVKRVVFGLRFLVPERFTYPVASNRVGFYYK